MKITGYKSFEKEEHKKITSYQIEMNGKRIMLDYGAPLKEAASNIDAIILTHEHFDHFYGMTYDFEYINCPIFATKTTKRLIIELTKKVWNTLLVDSINKLENIIELKFFNEYQILPGIDLTLFPSGHTFGSAMVLLNGENKLLYTSDMDYNKNNAKRQYYINDITLLNDLDYLLIDGTSLTKGDYKTQTVNRIIETSQFVKNRTYNVRPEKAVFIAQKMSEYKGCKDALIIYEKDLYWYLDILTSEGYYPYVDDKVVLDAPAILSNEYEKTIRLSSTNYQNHKINNVVGLHITLDAIDDFIYSLPGNPKVLVGHYSLEFIEEVREVALEKGFVLINEGVNNYEK